jgi:hypothetical protein
VWRSHGKLFGMYFYVNPNWKEDRMCCCTYANLGHVLKEDDEESG